jgi:hypothetical protein
MNEFSLCVQAGLIFEVLNEFFVTVRLVCGL